MEIQELIPTKVKKLEEYKPNLTPVNVRLDANESPFLPSKALLDKMSEAIVSVDFNRYPDPYASELTKAFAKIYEIDKDFVTAGNGSDELICLIASGFTEAGDKVIVVNPDFSMYSFYSSLAGAEVITAYKNDDFKIDFKSLSKTVNDTGAKLVIFSNPCNPTGAISTRDEILDFIRSTNAIIVVDEAYMEFSKTNESVMDLVCAFDNLIVLKTLSKAFGAAALRLGFAVCGRYITSSLRKIKSPYNVNSVSQTLGKVILDNYDEITNNTKIIINNLNYLKCELSKINSSKIIRIYDTAANFVFIKMQSSELAEKIKEKLMDNGVAIRYMNGGFLRICAGTKSEIDTFLNFFKEMVL